TVSFLPIPKDTVSEFVEAQSTAGSVGITSVQPASFLLLASRILPASVANRFVDIAPNDLSVWQRVLFIADAFKLWSMRPILGWGGGGWASTYRTAQSFNYTSAQSHGSFTDILSSYGAVGGLLYLAFWVLACLGVLKTQKGLPGRGFAVAGIGTLFFHSLIDFDFAYLMMVLLTISWLAVLNGPPKQSVWRPDARYMALGVGLLALVMVGSTVAHAEANAALASQNAKNSTQAVSDLNTALTFAPYDTTLWNDLATVQAGTGASAAPQVQADVARAIANAPHDPVQAQASASQLLTVGATSQGLALAKQVVRQAPHWETAYATVARAELFVGDTSYTHGKLKAAKLSFLAGEAALSKFNRIYASESAIPASVNIGPGVNFTLTQGELAALLSQVPLATSSLTQAASMDPAQAALADGWLYALGTVSGGVPNMPALQKVWSGTGGLTASEVGAIENAIRVLKPVKA
ncbi:MAG: O-antigen ligase family protein, partial [Sulfobacillus sp.]